MFNIFKSEKDKSGYDKRDPRLTKRASELLKSGKKDNSKVQKESARKLYKKSGTWGW